MPITAAVVEANGWVLRLTVSGAPGSFASYSLDPETNPGLVLQSTHPGFVRSGNTAVAGSIARSLVGTRPLRLPVTWTTAGNLNPSVIDETDLGGGLVQVRIALTEHVYASDTGLTLSARAGWRSGEAAAGIAVTNSSSVGAPIPIMRWVLPPYEVTSGPFRLSLFVASHHPQGYQPVAGVRFTVTDGTSVKSIWATELATDNSYGDALRCYTVVVDPGAAPALTAGLLRCDAEVYPWLGAMRSTDTAGTRAMANLRTDSFSVNAASPFVIGYDPAGSRYGQMWAFVDPANGTTTASAAMVATSLAAAKAVAVASRPRDINTALQAGALVNRTLPAANGQSSQSRSVDGMAIVLAAGSHSGAGATVVSTGTTTAEIPLRIIGDPDVANARDAVTLQTGANLPSRVNRIRYAGLTAEVGGTSLSNATYLWFDNVTVRGKAGSESSTAMMSTAPPAGQANLIVTQSLWWRTAATMGTVNNVRTLLARAVSHSRTIRAVAMVRNSFIGAAIDGFSPGNINCFQGWAGATLAGQVEDIVIAWNDVRRLGGRVFTYETLPAATAGTPTPSIRRVAMVGNIVEKIGSDPQPIYSIGEDVLATVSYNIMENNSFIGERTNGPYSDPQPATLAEADTLQNHIFVNRIANNGFECLASKQDQFSDTTTYSLRLAGNVPNPTGYRPHMIEGLSMLYGVGHEGNYDARRGGQQLNFILEYTGLRSLRTLDGNPFYTDDRSQYGTNTGGGNYVPLAGSPLNARVVRGNCDRDFAGVPRAALAAAGAFEPLPQALALVPAAGRHGQIGRATVSGLDIPVLPRGSGHDARSPAAALVIAFALAPAMASQGVASALPVTGWSAVLQADAGVMQTGVAASDLGLVIAVAPDPSRHAGGATNPILVGRAETLLAPADARLQLATLLLPQLLAGGEVYAGNTLVIGPDSRVLFVTP